MSNKNKITIEITESDADTIVDALATYGGKKSILIKKNVAEIVRLIALARAKGRDE